MRKPIIVGNWKLNKTIAEAMDFIEAIEPRLHDTADFGVATSYIALASCAQKANKLLIAAQNVSDQDSGAFTGEVSVSMLQEIGVKFVVIGHSERRQYYNETDQSVNAKVLKTVAAGMTPIVCVGERLEEFEANQTEAVVRRQTKLALQGLSAEQVAQLVIAYEPVWAIGTGKNATKEIAQNTCAIVRDEVKRNFNQAAADAVRIQYGGSVKPDNIAEYLSEADIDGALIGGASLKVDSFSEIIEATKG
jgi:triosephosphate isomerase (TIM)